MLTNEEIQNLFYHDELWVSALEEDEKYIISFIRKYLITDAQKQRLYELNADIADLLNGRIRSNIEDPYSYFFDDWNEKLGKKEFRF